MISTNSLGEDIRALRNTRKMTLKDMAAKLGCSLGWISQVERDLSTPNMDTMNKIADVLDVPTSIFFSDTGTPESEVGRIVRSNSRRVIADHHDGLSETLVSPDLTDSFEMIHSVFLSGAERKEFISRPTQEVAYIVSGKLDIWIDEQFYRVSKGDSLRIRGEPFRWSNPYKKPVVAIWVISPPVY